jgi:hypothetical protein
MSKDIYIGGGVSANKVTDMCVGIGGIARNVRSMYIGDENNIARLCYGKPYDKGIITPSNMTSDTAPAPLKASEMTQHNANHPAFNCFSSGTHNYNVAISSGGFTADSDIPTKGEWWIQVYLGEAKFCDSGRLSIGYCRSDMHHPADFQILGSNDPAAWNTAVGTNLWDICETITNYPMPATVNWFVWRDYFPINKGGFYSYYRIRCTRSFPTGTAGSMTIGKIQLLAT